MDKEDTDTIKLLEKWHRGDPGAVEELLSRHLTWIHQHVRNRLGPRLRKRLESTDLVHDAAVEFLQYGPRFMPSNEKQFRGLIGRIVENVIRDKRDWFQARRRTLSLENPLPSDTVIRLEPLHKVDRTPSQSAQDHEEEAWIRLGMELLKPEDREVLVLRQWDHLAFGEIAERIDITKEAAWVRHKRAVTRLGKLVGQLRRGRFAFMNEDPG